MEHKMIFSDDDLVIWFNASDVDITMYFADRGVGVKFSPSEWDEFQKKMIVTAHSQGVGLIDGFDKLYGTQN